jgi:surfeit locus 1 family protein
VTTQTPPVSDAPPRRSVARVVLLAGLALAFIGFVALGVWQIERRAWKLDLIQRVEARIDAAPVEAPGPAQWPLVDAARDEYRRVKVEGHFLTAQAVRVQAVTALGSGYWWMVPLQRDDGTVVLVNRGFIATEVSPDSLRDMDGKTRQSITGLLRLSEPGGGFLRRNAPALDRWYSRDVQAIADSRELERVAPYFIDADRDPVVPAGEADGRSGPVGGLTVVRFNNNHLQYALTWFALALMVVAAAWRVWREKPRAAGDPPSSARLRNAGNADHSQE